MEMGQVRFEASISVRPEGATELGTRIEVKNLNSFRAVSRAVAYEIERQTAALKSGEKLTQETRLWDEVALRTEPMRTKETAMDYRYFPEPDLTPLDIDQAWIDRVKAELPELAEPRRERLMREHGLSAEHAGVLTSDRALVDKFEEAVKDGADPQLTAGLLIGEPLRLAREQDTTPERILQYVQPYHITSILRLWQAGTVSGTAAKEVFSHVIATGKSPEVAVDELGLRQISDEAQLSATVNEVLKENPDAVANFRGGNEKSIGFLVGQVMRKSGKRANPQLVNQLIREKLGG
jgi:aspartyl-tRNA(Asn)/glutamyl-tRNA(Gln) amidotransferase subunit B